MARWEPDAQGRLLRTAIELFTRQGYDATTTAQIAEGACLTKTTLFRLFPDKREILFHGQRALVDLAVAAVQQAPAGSSMIAAVAAAVSAMTDAHVADRSSSRQLARVIAASAELQERAAFKRWSISVALQAALVARIGDARRAGILADLGVRAYYDGFSSWITIDDERSLTAVVLEELARCEAASRTLLSESRADSGKRLSTPIQP